MKLMKFLLVALFILFSGCVKESFSVNKQKLPSNIRVYPFANLTQTPMAGYRVASILEGVLKSKGYHIKGSLWDFEEKDYSIEDIKDLLQNAKADYIITGYVNEYRYKTGIDGEPAVSFTIKVFSTKAHKYIYTATYSGVGDTYSSVGVLTQEGLKKIIKNIEVK